MDESKDPNPDSDKARKEGNFCIATGLGVGAVGVTSALAAGVVCPLCYVVPPVLIGMGLIRRRQCGGPKKPGDSED
ncbi:MAG: hypothetical protein J5J00_04505 [Deltaproteobacteria bacterium]|nr:hypothetical protein [Deltaproteobacteria bacterium]